MAIPTPQHPLRLQYLLLSVVATVLLSSSTCQAASSKMVLPACADTRGYEALSGIRISYRAGGFSPLSGQDGQALASVELAMKACNDDPGCIAFNNFGTTTRLGRVGDWVRSGEACTYVKRIAPKKPGFRLRLFTKALLTDTYRTPSAQAAEAACRSSPACTAWDTDGTYGTGNKGFVPSDKRLVTYEKIACEDKFGYTTYNGFRVGPVRGVDNGAISGTNNNKTEVEEFCKLNYQCTAFDSNGNYFIGGVGEYVAQSGLCTWVKHPCAPMRGFIAYNDIAYKNKEGLLSRPSKDCFNSVYTECLGNPNCRSFNNMRYMFGPNQAPVSDTTTESAPGMCLYVKIADGSRAA